MILIITRFFLFFYRFLISPILHLLSGTPYGCRFTPSCSTYASEAISLHGLYKGGFLALKRIFRCHPFSEAGYDPVPCAIQGRYLSSTRKVKHGP